MALQTLVGFSRYKENFKGTDYELDEKGNKVYMQKISTETHGINIKNLQVLEDLGFIKIESIKNSVPPEKEKKGIKNLLILEKLGFKNYEDLRKMGKAVLQGDKETIDNMRKPLKKITFRLTDKPIDFEELYIKSSNLSKVEDKQERLALRRMTIIFGKEHGILSTKNIDIAKDRLGRDYIKYNTKESFGKRVSKNTRTEETKGESIKDTLKEEVDIEKAVQKYLENSKTENVKDNQRE